MEDLVIGTLPPCRICGGKASGYHYGANTCEACKAFFRRGLSKFHIYECAESGNCEISFRKRSSCAYCRFQKCLRNGMNKEASKPGRYTHEKKASNIKEVKELLAQAERLSYQDSPSTHSSSEFNQPIRSEDSNNKHFKTELNRSITSTSNNLFRRTDQTSIECGSSSEQGASFQYDMGHSSKSAATSSVSSNDIGQRISESVAAESSSRAVLYDVNKIDCYKSIIARMHEKHKIYANEDEDLRQQLSKIESDHLQMVEMKKKILGPPTHLSPAEYRKFYRETGIDIDGRKELMIDCLPKLELSLKQHIGFAKTIPGFNELCLNDQVNLIKAGRYDSFIISRHRRFNPKYKLYSPYNGKVLHMEDLIMLKGSFVENLFKIEEKIHSLKLHSEETVVLSALCIMYSDNCELADRALVERSQDFLLECLFYLFDKYHPDDRLRFPKVIDCLTEVRSVREDNSKFEERCVELWCDIIDMPPLLSELWSADEPE